MKKMPETYDNWLREVREALSSINMKIEDWQGVWPFDFVGEHKVGTTPADAATKANRFWWREQNKSLKQSCHRIPGCWLPNGHRGECKPAYESGDYVKVEFPDKATGIAEWMWMRVDHQDDTRRLVFGTLDNEPLNDYAGKIKLGSQLAISYAQIREHKTSAEFKP